MSSIEEIYREYFKDVYLYILRLSGNEQIAEDITSDTFFKAIKGINSFREDCDIRVWLCQIAKNSYFTYLKKNKHLKSIDETQLINLPSIETNPEDKAVDKDLAERIRLILHDLPDTYREVYMWRVFAELSFKEIGQIFGKTENWACVTYHRARMMIIKGIGE